MSSGMIVLNIKGSLVIVKYRGRLYSAEWNGICKTRNGMESVKRGICKMRKGRCGTPEYVKRGTAECGTPECGTGGICN